MFVTVIVAVAHAQSPLRVPVEPSPVSLADATLDEGVVTEAVADEASSSPLIAAETADAGNETDATASWFGPGLWGGRTACGLTLTAELRGVAHRTLPCGSTVTLRYGATTMTVAVVDRGPFAHGREFDLTYATRVALGCPDICYLSWVR